MNALEPGQANKERNSTSPSANRDGTETISAGEEDCKQTQNWIKELTDRRN